MTGVAGDTNKAEAAAPTQIRRSTTNPFEDKRGVTVKRLSSEARRRDTLAEEMVMKIRRAETGTGTTASANRTRIAAGGAHQGDRVAEMETAGAEETAQVVEGNHKRETPVVEAAMVTATNKGCRRLIRTTRTGP